MWQQTYQDVYANEVHADEPLTFVKLGLSLLAQLQVEIDACRMRAAPSATGLFNVIKLLSPAFLTGCWQDIISKVTRNPTLAEGV